MRKKLTGLLFLPALLALACSFGGQDVTEIVQLATPEPPNWPQVNPAPPQFLPGRPAGDTAPHTLELARVSRRFPERLPLPPLNRAVAFPGAEKAPPPMPAGGQPVPVSAPVLLRDDLSAGNRVIIVNQPVWLDTVHRSDGRLTTIQLALNGQPLRGETGSFPSSLLAVKVCAGNVWQTEESGRSALFCTEAPVAPDSTVDVSAAQSREQRLSLIVTGFVPGRYRLTLTTSDEFSRSHEYTQMIEVIKPL